MGHPKLLWVGPGPPVLEAFEAGGHAVRAVYIPPFAEARRMGHPSFLGLVESGKVGHRLLGLVGSARVGHPAMRYGRGPCMGHPPDTRALVVG
jgi:hypothetical protein